MVRSSKELTWLALLRGVNVGGNNILPMKTLANMFTEIGCADARTYIQSGNVIFRASQQVATGLPEKLSARVSKQFGFAVPVVMRTAEQLGQIIREKPFPDSDDGKLHVYFLAATPATTDVGGLDPQRSPGDDFLVRNREVYVRLPNGMARTKLTNAYFDSKLNTNSTARNWRTVLKLFELMQ